MSNPMADPRAFRARSQSATVRAAQRRRWSTGEVAQVQSDASFMAEALSQATCDLEQALTRETRLKVRVAELEAHCRSLSHAHEELAAAIDELTMAQCRAAESVPAAAPPQLALVPACAPQDQPSARQPAPPPLASANPRARPSLAAQARMSRRVRQLTWKASWDDPPDDRDELAAARVNPPWYARPAIWGVAVFAAVVALVMLAGGEQDRFRQDRLAVEIPATYASPSTTHLP